MKKTFFVKILSLLIIVLVCLFGSACRGADGEDGRDGKDGITPTIEINEAGFWVINGEVTKYNAIGNVNDLPTIGISSDGYWEINGVATTWKAEGEDGTSAAVRINEYFDYWEVSYDGEKTWKSLGVKADNERDLQNTIFSVTISESKLNLDFRVLGSKCEGAKFIDWGDGNYNAIVSERDLQHKYVSAGEYDIEVVGLTKINELAFRERSEITRLVVGESVTYIGRMAFSNCSKLTEVTFNSVTPPEFVEPTSSNPGLPYSTFTMTYVKKINVPEGALYDYKKAYTWSVASGDLSYAGILNNGAGAILGDKTVTVGANGDFTSIGDAIDYLSLYYPTYKKGGIKCEIKILAGTVINEQIYASQIDLSFITIVAEASGNNTEKVTIDGKEYSFAVVPVNARGFAYTADAHDSRGNYPFIAGENSANLPAIGCVFRLMPETVESGMTVCGLLCNRGSSAVVLPASGFDGFYDGVIANNESSVTIREGISRNMTRWGVHARHNGEVSARSCVITNCGIAAYADRVADLDIREAVLDGSIVAIESNNLSRVNANGTHAKNCGALGGYVVKVANGGFVNCADFDVSNYAGNLYNIQLNTLTSDGVIFD